MDCYINSCSCTAGLTFLDLADNALKGTLPTKLYEMQGLYALLLSQNALAGPLPLKPADVVPRRLALHRLDVGSNRFTGSIGQDFLSLVMELFQCSSNIFEGTLPKRVVRRINVGHRVWSD